MAEQTTVIVGKDAPANMLYLQEMAQTIRVRMRSSDKDSKADIELLHKMVIETINASK